MTNQEQDISLTELKDGDGLLSPEIGRIIFDEGIQSRYITLRSYLENNHISYKEDELNQIQKNLHETLLESVTKYALLEYYIASLSENKDVLVDKVQASIFYTCWEHKDVSQLILDEQSDSLLNILNDQIRTYDYHALSPQVAVAKRESFVFEFLDRPLFLANNDLINELCQFMAIPLRLLYWVEKDLSCFLLCEYGSVKRGQSNIHKEWMGSLQVKQSVPDMMINGTRYIRNRML